MRINYRALFAITSVTLVCAGTTSCWSDKPSSKPSASQVQSPAQSPGVLSVAVNVWAIDWLVQQVGGDLVTTQQLEAEAHEPPTDADLRLLEKVDSVVLVGHMSVAAQQVIDRRWPEKSKERARFTDVSVDTVPLLPAPPELGDEQLPEGKDPHIWLDPVNMKDVVTAVGRALSEAIRLSPALGEDRVRHANEVNGRVQEVRDRLDQLNTDIRGMLQGCGARTVVAEHPAYQYLAERYGLAQLPITKFTGGVLGQKQMEVQRRALARIWKDGGQFKKQGSFHL